MDPLVCQAALPAPVATLSQIVSEAGIIAKETVLPVCIAGLVVIGITDHGWVSFLWGGMFMRHVAGVKHFLPLHEFGFDRSGIHYAPNSGKI